MLKTGTDLIIIIYLQMNQISALNNPYRVDMP